MWRFLLASSLVCAAYAAPVANTSLGPIIGQVASSEDAHSCQEWLGIPYAEAPIGNRRFASPVPWTTQFPSDGFKATSYGHWCPQYEEGSAYVGNEDCLKLNVWAPASQQGVPLAVMVWIHGGAFVSGDDGDAATLNTYSGCGLVARHGVINVGMNYRLGPLGFLAFPGSGASAPVDSNWGMQDQREALRWVQREIHNFGGNPKKVTIFGESAGAISVWYHIASPISKGLFQAAISQSGFPSAVTGTFSIHHTRAYAAKLGCTDIPSLDTCLRTKSVEDLIGAADEGGNPFLSAGWNPCIDGLDMPKQPGLMLNDSRASTVPFLAGFNTDEATVFVYPNFPAKMNDSQFSTFVHESMNKDPQYDPAHAVSKSIIDQILAKYPLKPGVDNRIVASNLLSESSFQCGTVIPAITYATRAKMYLYRFNHRTSFTRSDPTPGVFHSLDLPYVFGTPGTYKANFTQDETALSNRMQAMWTSFAKDSTPEGGSVGFPLYANATRKALLLDTIGDSIDSDFKGDYCNFWAKIYQEEHHMASKLYGMHASMMSYRKTRPSSEPTSVYV